MEQKRANVGKCVFFKMYGMTSTNDECGRGVCSAPQATERGSRKSKGWPTHQIERSCIILMSHNQHLDKMKQRQCQRALRMKVKSGLVKISDVHAYTSTDTPAHVYQTGGNMYFLT